ncbi:TOG array regulator of axonemal microtubules protein 1 [Clonorchis sinensis]|uniref:TOG array regulator of axonemal microtubules protein 1 n=1 Tax=Clonorchis sinensis TaxID=79923 RepID=A0A8T1LZ88_CLOSI|nr:TOG array regulator of axonemal microtubules protein 1 [Clonorchis sinensis]
MWTKENPSGTLSGSNLDLPRVWAYGFLQREPNVCDPELLKHILRENKSFVFRSYMSAPDDDNCSSCSTTLDDKNIPISYRDVRMFLSRNAFENMIRDITMKSYTMDSAYNRKALNAYLAAEELRDNISTHLANSKITEIEFPEGERDIALNSNELIHNSRPIETIITLLNFLMQSRNFNVLVCCLEIASMLVDAVGCHRQKQPHPSFIHCGVPLRFFDMLRVALSDRNLVVRVAATKLCRAISRLPKGAMLVIEKLIGPCLSEHVCDTRQTSSCSENSHRVCQELVDVTTSLLLTLPSSQFDLTVVCNVVIRNGLLNRQTSVRTATLDCVAVVAHLLGPGNLAPLLTAVSQADHCISDPFSTVRHENGLAAGIITQSGNLIWDAVQRRLAQRRLPQLDRNGRVIRGLPHSHSRSSEPHKQSPQSSGDYDEFKQTLARTTWSSSTASAMNSTVSNQANSRGLHRRPSAGSLHKTHRLPWDPRSGTDLSTTSVNEVASPSPRNQDTGRDGSLYLDTETNDSNKAPTNTRRDSTSLKAAKSRNSPLPSSAIRGRRLSRSLHPTKSPSDGLESQSVPNSGGISPIASNSPRSTRPVIRDQKFPIYPPSCGIPLPASANDDGLLTPRRKPLLAPLRQKDSTECEKPNTWNLSNALSKSHVPNNSSPLLPTRATLGRQSSRSKNSSRSGMVTRRSANELNRFGFERPSPRKQNDHLPTELENARRPTENQTGGDDINARIGQLENEKFETDLDEDIQDDDDDEDDDESISLASSKKTIEQPHLRGSLKSPEMAKRPVRLNSESNLCRSADSELSEVSIVRSAASHRRAMRLFAEAERKRRAEETTPNEDQQVSESPVDVSNLESSCPVPVLSPAIIPAVPIQRAVAPSKFSARRRSTLTPQQPNPTTHQLISSDSKASKNSTPTSRDQPSGLGPSPLPTKYNPYTGASFRDNPDYNGLVVGRSAGSSGQLLQLSSSPDLHRLGHAPTIPSGERKPLKGQHNISSGLFSSTANANPLAGDLPCSSSSCVAFGSASSASLSSSINIVGRSLFESQSNASPSPGSYKPNGSEVGSSSLSGSPQKNDVPVPELSPNPNFDMRPIRPSVLSLGPNVPEPLDARSLEGGSQENSEAHVSSTLRQRVLQKKTKELQKLRTSGKSSVTSREADSKQNRTSALPAEFDDGIPSTSTWPQKGTGNSVSDRERSYRQSQSSSSLGPSWDVAPNAETQPTSVCAETSSLVQQPRRPMEHGGPSRPQRANSHVSGTHVSNTPTSTSFPRVQSSDCLNNLKSQDTSGYARDSQTNKNDPTSRLIASPEGGFTNKGRSSLHMSATTSALPMALRLIQSEDWESKVSGLERVAQLAVENPNAFNSNLGAPVSGVSVSAGSSRQPLNSTETLNQTVQAVIAECKNLRSQVSRQAVQTLSTLFHGLGRAMDPHVEICVRVLLGKTGEAAAAFLRDEVAVAMNEVTQAANPSRTLPALMQHGLGHKNPAVRLQTALQIAGIVENLPNPKSTSASRRSGSTTRISTWDSSTNLNASGSSGVLGSLLDRLVTAMSQFLTDGNQETRYYGRRLLRCLQQHPDFERTVKKQLNGQPLRAVREALDQIQTKGVGDPPVISAGSRRKGMSPAPSPSVTRGSSANTPSKP